MKFLTNTQLFKILFKFLLAVDFFVAILRMLQIYYCMSGIITLRVETSMNAGWPELLLLEQRYIFISVKNHSC